MTDPAVSERDHQRIVVKLLETFRWNVCHVFPLLDSHGVYRTPTTAKGWPDIVALRQKFVLAIEVKGRDAKGKAGRIRPEQLDWLDRWAQVPCARAWVLTPNDDLRTVMGWVRDPANAPRVHGWSPNPVRLPV